MDAVNLNYIWSNFPGIVASARFHYAAGLYEEILRNYLNRKRKRTRRKVFTTREERMLLLKEVERRIVLEDLDDLTTILAV